MDGPELGIIIPAYNEEATISDVIAGIGDLGKPIVVDDCSQDNTGEIARRAGADIVRHDVNKGYDGALDSGFRRAAKMGCVYVVTIDADGQHDPALILKFADTLKLGYDLVLGVRDRKQRFSEHLFAWVTAKLYGIKDPLCGMKAYRMDIYRCLGHFDSYGSIGTELALFGVRSGYRFKQIEVPTREREGESRFGRFIRGNYLILRAMMLSFLRIRPQVH